MEHTMPNVTQLLANEQEALARFRRALRAEDQRALDALFQSARHHVAALALASHLLPFEVMLLGMLIEEHKRVDRLERRLSRAQSHPWDEMESCDEEPFPHPPFP